MKAFLDYSSLGSMFSESSILMIVEGKEVEEDVVAEECR